MIHGDYRLDNLMFSTTEDDDVVAVDWQTMIVGPPTRDVAYFLGTSLDVDDRRAAEEQLVASYHRALVARGVDGYDADRCFDDYRVGQLQGPMITVIGCMYATADAQRRGGPHVPRDDPSRLRRDPGPRLDQRHLTAMAAQPRARRTVR